MPPEIRPRSRRVVLLIYPDATSLDVVGPAEMFQGATKLFEYTQPQDPAPYTVEFVAPEAGPVPTSTGVELVAAKALDEVEGEIDTLIVAGGWGCVDAGRDARVLGFLQEWSGRVRRLCSVCTGSLILADAGLLQGKHATTHWAFMDALAAREDVITEPDPIFVRDGHIYTSAGVTAGMDLALALIEDDLGRDVANYLAKYFVLFVQRPGRQPQVSAPVSAQKARLPTLRDLQMFIINHPNEDLSLSALAGRVGMSTRNFTRVFTREVGESPGRFVESVRVEAARRRLDETSEGIEEIADRCGFGSAESMRRAFRRRLSVAPSEYRRAAV